MTWVNCQGMKTKFLSIVFLLIIGCSSKVSIIKPIGEDSKYFISTMFNCLEGTSNKYLTEVNKKLESYNLAPATKLSLCKSKLKPRRTRTIISEDGWHSILWE